MPVFQKGGEDDLQALHAAKGRVALLSRGQVRTALIVLTVVNSLNFIDRQIINILAEPIRQDLKLSDTQLGLMTGFAFAVFYAVLGLPLARLADRPSTNRVTLISVCLVIWSAMTALGGVAQSFTQLLLARVGVAIGEAGGAPPAHSLISDITPRETRASAMAVYGLGIPIGVLLGMVMGGGLFDLFGWRTALMMVGAPGVLLALLLPLVLKEPRRSAKPASTERIDSPPPAPLREALAELGRSRTFLFLVAGSTFVAFLSYGTTVWQAVLFIRVLGLSPGQAGLWLGLTAGIAGGAGIYLGGFLADSLGARRPRRILLAPTVGLAATSPLLIAGYLQADWRLTLAFIALPAVASTLFYGPTFSLAHRLVRPQVRATASAVMIFINNLIGIGLGPLLFGVMSDVLEPKAGVDSVRWVLAGSGLVSLLPALCFWIASRTIDRDIKS